MWYSHFCRPGPFSRPHSHEIATGSPAVLSAFRFSLALMVMAIHLGGPLPPQLGRAAVEGFFCISGFLITMVANQRYAARPLAFLANRFLRIYPTYWCCLLLSFCIVRWIPESIHLHPSLYVPATKHDLLANLAIFGLTQQTPSRLLPAAWSLATELWFYLVIGLVTSTRPRATLALMVLSSIVSCAAAAGWLPVAYYGTPLGNGYAFFIGSAAWHYRRHISTRLAPMLLLAGFAVFEILAWTPAATMPTSNVFLAAPAIGIFLVGLWNVNMDVLLGKLASVCGFLGRLAYPVFLLHWPLALLAHRLGGYWHDGGMFVLTSAFSGGIGIALVLTVERYIENWRRRLREPLKYRQPALAAAP